MATARIDPLYQRPHQTQGVSKPYRQSPFTVREFSAMKHVEQATVNAYCDYMERAERAEREKSQ